MKNRIKLIIPTLACIGALAGCGPENPQANRFTKYALPEEAAGYYSTFNFQLKGGRMLTHIHAHCFEKHQVFVKYNDIARYYNWEENSKTGAIVRDSIDCPTPGTKKIEYFYTAKITEGKSYSGANREHVWPCANSSKLWTHEKEDGAHYVDGNNYAAGGSDLYHVRPAVSATNSARGNSRFVDFDDFPEKSYTPITDNGGRFALLCNGLDSNNEYANFVEVDDNYKGDVARLLAYVYVHYGSFGGVSQDITTKYCGGLSLTNILGYSERECKEKLCEWNELDPPSQIETHRNDTVQKIQGNRNMFVDYPGLMPRMFGLD